MSTATTNTGGVPDPLAGAVTGRESSLSTWAGPYVTNMLGMGQALAQTPYQAYTGPLTAGTSQAQQQAFSGIAGLAVPTQQMGAFTPTSFTGTMMGANKPMQVGTGTLGQDVSVGAFGGSSAGRTANAVLDSALASGQIDQATYDRILQASPMAKPSPTGAMMGAPQGQIFQNKAAQVGMDATGQAFQNKPMQVGTGATGQAFQNKPMQVGVGDMGQDVSVGALGLSQATTGQPSIYDNMPSMPTTQQPMPTAYVGEYRQAAVPVSAQQGLGSIAQQYMSPYLQAALEPQIAEARRQAQISRLQDAARLSKAGAFGGTRQAVMEAEGQRNLLRNLADITGTGYQQAFTQAQQQFNTEQDRAMAAQQLANRYGLDVLGEQARLGGQEYAMNQAAIDAARRQFEEERLFPYKQIQFQQSLLQGLPLAAQAYNYQQPTGLSQLLGGSAGIMSLLENLFKTPTFSPADQAAAAIIGTQIPSSGSPDDALDAIDYAANLPI